MHINDHGFDFLNTRTNCNNTIKHLENMKEFIRDFEQRQNLADILNPACAQKTINQSQLRPIINALLVDKYHYAYGSCNLTGNFDRFKEAAKIVSRWNAVDLFCVYHHPELGVLPINPKNPSHWEKAQFLKQHEFLAIYAGEYNETDPEGKDTYEMAIRLMIEILSGKSVRPQPKLEKGKCVYKPVVVKAAAETKAAPKKKKKTMEPPPIKVKKTSLPEKEAESDVEGKEMTRMYGITVTNELFHNGNVEAWKRIINAYEHTYPGIEVVVYYAGERIHDINSLFKWGKVRRGTAIMLALVGENIKDLSKLRRYLEEGAGVNFERFIKGHQNSILRLFG